LNFEGSLERILNWKSGNPPIFQEEIQLAKEIVPHHESNLIKAFQGVAQLGNLALQHLTMISSKGI
jgi:hypothetical protein